MGNDLDPLSLKELQSLEQQLDTALKRIRTRKVKCANFFISLQEIIKKIETTEENKFNLKIKELTQKHMITLVFFLPILN